MLLLPFYADAATPFYMLIFCYIIIALPHYAISCRHFRITLLRH